MISSPFQHYCYGAARISLPGPISRVKKEKWYSHPTFSLIFVALFFLFAIVLSNITRVAIQPKTDRTIVQFPPEPQKKPEVEKKKPFIKPVEEKEPVPQKKVKISEKKIPLKVKPLPIKKHVREKVIPPPSIPKRPLPKKIDSGSLEYAKQATKKIAPEKILARKIVPKKIRTNDMASSAFKPLSRSISPSKPGLNSIPAKMTNKTLSLALSQSLKRTEMRLTPKKKIRPSAPVIALTVKRPLASYAKADKAKTKENEIELVILGQIVGQSNRVPNLKKEILRKAKMLDAKDSPFCCSIGEFKCKIAVEGNGKKRITIRFSKDDVPFEIVSKLERRLPSRLEKCYD